VGIPKNIIIVLVNKRVKTKLIVDSGPNRVDSPKPGLVVDHTITPNNSWDFFMVSQNTRQGVPTPSHYTILHDSIGMGPELIQALTYKLCWLYYNYSGPVKIPAPLKYADKMCKLLGERGNIVPHKRFQELAGLYFI